MDKVLIFLISIFFLFFLFFTGSVFLNSNPNLRTLIKAKEELQPSAEASLILAWPLQLSADNKSTAEINVFVRSVKGNPVSNRTVKLETNLGNVVESEQDTDKQGHVSFHLSSGQPGEAIVTAVVDNSIKLTQTVSIKFE